MKRIYLIILFTIACNYSFAQLYKVEDLKPVVTIWGETYLFHPQVVLKNNTVQWEKRFVDFLPLIKGVNDVDKVIRTINNDLLSYLADDFTRVQKKNNNSSFERSPIDSIAHCTYFKLRNEDYENVDNLNYWLPKIVNSALDKPLVIDCRLDTNSKIAPQSYNFMEYFLSMFIQNEIELSQNVIREHFGWDEYNEWWYYEQRWKVANKDFDIVANGKLLPFLEYQQFFAQRGINLSFDGFKPIDRTLIFIVNNTFNSYYGNLLSDVRSQRRNTYIIKENQGDIHTPIISSLKRYEFPGYDFILNPIMNVSSDKKYGLYYDDVVDVLSADKILSFLKRDKQNLKNSQHDFSLAINPVKYSSSGPSLTVEEKIMGLIKAYTIIKYFHINKEEIIKEWDKNLDIYLMQVQETKSDKEYFEVLLKMFSILNDSHVFVEHSSMLDFSALHVVPVEFDWIENKAIVTSVEQGAADKINVGDEILSIDGVKIYDFINQKKNSASHSNEQGLISSAVTFTNFTGKPNSIATYIINRGNHVDTVKLERNSHVFSLLGKPKRNGKSLNIFKGDIGYLDIANVMDEKQLSDAIEQIKNTKGLILDLRNSYPILSVYDILSTFCTKKVISRIAQVPIVSAYSDNTIQTTVTSYTPNSDYVYSKPIAVLIDKSMISRPEDIAMTLRAFDNVTFIGEQTQGTNGEMTKIYLPGNGSISFTGQIIQYGNGAKFQRIGIIPDIPVTKTINGVINNEDEILSHALKYLNNETRN